MGQTAQQRLANTADVLTAARLPGAIAATLLIASDRWAMVALLVSTVWISDLLDGRLARLSLVETHLGRFDLAFDTLFGVGIVAGLLTAGVLPLWIGAVALVLFVGFAVGNFAAAMLLQLTGYVPLLLELWQRMPVTWWTPFIAASLAALVDWRRLVYVNIPKFIRGVTGHFEAR